jgi:hypothetical protein
MMTVMVVPEGAGDGATRVAGTSRATGAGSAAGAGDATSGCCHCVYHCLTHGK